MIACDRWREAELREKLELIDFPMTTLEVRGQGFKDGGEDVRIFRKACASGDVRPERSLLLRAALAEARVTGDPAGNWKLAKNTQGGRRSHARDDAAAAAILAVASGMRRTRLSTGLSGRTGEGCCCMKSRTSKRAWRRLRLEISGARWIPLPEVRESWPPGGRPYKAVTSWW